jgi:hypothetical protein
MPEDILQKYYQYLKDNNADVPKDYSIFQYKMSDKPFAEKYFGYLKDNQFDVPDKFETFSGKLNLFNEDPKQKLAPKNTKELSSAQDVGMAFTVPQAKKETEEEMNKSAAVNNSFKTWLGLTKTDENSLQAKNKKKELQDGLGNGSYNIAFDAKGVPTLGMSIGGLHSFTKSLKETGDAYDEGKNLRTMDNHSAVKYLNKKMSAPEEFLPETPDGILGYLGDAGGGISRIIAKEGAGTLAVRSIAGLLSPETGGLSLAALSVLGGIPGAADEIANLNYGAELQKYYVKGKEMKLSDDEAIAKAREQANFALGSGVLEAAAYTAGGEIFGAMFKGGGTGSGVKKAISKAFRYAAPATALATSVPVASSVARDLHAKQVGYNLTNEEIFKNAWDKSSDALKITAGTFLLHAGIHGAIKMDNYVNSQLKNFVASANNNIAERFLDVLSEAQIINPTEASKTKEDINQTRQAQQKIKLLGVESNEDVHGSLVNKYQEKVKIQAEIDQLEKDGIKAGIEERKNRITQLDKDIQDIYKTGDTDKHEVNLEVPLADDHFSPAPKENKPFEEGNVIKFKSAEGQDVFGKRMDIPGHEDLHIMVVDGENGKEVWEQSIGRKLGIELKGATPTEDMPNQIADYLDKNKITADWLYNKIDKAENIEKYSPGKDKFRLSNETEGYNKYKEKKQAEIDAVPFVYEGEDRAKLEELRKEAEANGETNIVDNILNVELNKRQTKGFTKNALENIQQRIDFTRERDKKAETLKNAREEKVPLPAEMMGQKQEGTPKELEKNLSSYYKKPQMQKVPAPLKAVLEEAYAKSSAIVNKYGYYPNDYLDAVKFNPEMALARLVRTINGTNLEKKAERMASAEAEVYQVARQIEDYAKKEGIDLGTTALDAHETEAHKQSLLQTVKGTEYENQARDAGLRGEIATRPTEEVSPKPSGEVTTQNWETAGYRSESDFNADYESNRDRAAGETKEIFLAKKHCGEL